MSFPPTIKRCFVRDAVIVSWPQSYFREILLSTDNLLSVEQAQQMIAALQAAIAAVPEADDSGMVQPAFARHLPRIAAVYVEELPGAWSDADVDGEGAEWVPVDVEAGVEVREVA